MIKRLKTATLIEVLLHLLFWAVITLLPILNRRSDPSLQTYFPAWHLIAINGLLALQFYLNAFVYIPLFIHKNNKPWLFISLLIISFLLFDICVINLQPVIAIPIKTFPFGPPPATGHFHLLPFAAITAAAFAYRYLADRFIQINTRRDITNSALVSELAFLRSQISPHFIFNVINSVVALSRLNPAAVEPTLMQLSRLMRYMLYITDEEKVTMKQKADYLNSYIELQKMRFDDQVKVDFTINVKHPEKTIEPMLIVPFVENAFKYTNSDAAEPLITGYLQSDDKLLDFCVSNTYNPNQQHPDGHHGIGLHNVRRRLDLLYPGQHKLTINEDKNTYTINLKIQLK